MRVLGWALVHFLWQGAAIGTLLAAILAAVPRSAPRIRYAFGCTALLAMVCCLPMTVAYLSHAASLPTLPVIAGSVGSSDAVVSPGVLLVMQAVRARFEGYLPWLAAGWMLGVAVLLARVAGGWLVSRQWVRHARPLNRDIRALASRLDVTRAVDILVSPLAAVPHAVGWMKPAVVLPLGVVTGLPAAQLEAIIAHELAHVARHDFLVNLVQTLAESVLFFHPAVWWTSARIRADREACCDDMVVALTGDPGVYARALLSIEHARTDLVPAAAGSDLRQRIERMLRMPRRDVRVAPFCVAASALMLMVGATWLHADSVTLDRPSMWRDVRVAPVTAGAERGTAAAPGAVASEAPRAPQAPALPAPPAPPAPSVRPPRAPQAPSAPPAPLVPPIPSIPPIPPIPPVPPLSLDDHSVSEHVQRALEQARQAIEQASATWQSEVAAAIQSDVFKADMRRTVEEAARQVQNARRALERARPALERAKAAAERAKARHGAPMNEELTKAIDAARAAAEEARKVVESDEFRQELREALEEALDQLRSPAERQRQDVR